MQFANQTPSPAFEVEFCQIVKSILDLIGRTRSDLSTPANISSGGAHDSSSIISSEPIVEPFDDSCWSDSPVYGFPELEVRLGTVLWDPKDFRMPNDPEASFKFQNGISQVAFNKIRHGLYPGNTFSQGFESIWQSDLGDDWADDEEGIYDIQYLTDDHIAANIDPIQSIKTPSMKLEELARAKKKRDAHLLPGYVNGIHSKHRSRFRTKTHLTMMTLRADIPDLDVSKLKAEGAPTVLPTDSEKRESPAIRINFALEKEHDLKNVAAVTGVVLATDNPKIYRFKKRYSLIQAYLIMPDSPVWSKNSYAAFLKDDQKTGQRAVRLYESTDDQEYPQWQQQPKNDPGLAAMWSYDLTLAWRDNNPQRLHEKIHNLTAAPDFEVEVECVDPIRYMALKQLSVKQLVEECAARGRHLYHVLNGTDHIRSENLDLSEWKTSILGFQNYIQQTHSSIV